MSNRGQRIDTGKKDSLNRPIYNWISSAFKKSGLSKKDMNVSDDYKHNDTNHKKSRMSKMVSVGVTAALAVSLTGCSPSDDVASDYSQVCLDKSSNQRVEDSRCDDIDTSHNNNALMWYYLGHMHQNNSVKIPAVGEKAESKFMEKSTTTKPTNVKVHKVGSEGGKAKTVASKGGFGARGGGSHS